ncbi:type II toxin-antitoxin system PemK/MazF family toxin [Staphylococcus auricularis]|uniref:type II toxin-antitoxin system PemK/MazF family toxin n=1 Tax=Staphylococcus auricularis TaxID=29379 RepID=UPI003F79313B
MMINQFDVIMIDLNPTRGKEKQKYRPCVVVSNDFVNQHSPFVWILPITNRSKRFPSDIPIETKNNSVTGIIDSIQIRSLDAKVRNFKKIDELNESIKIDVINTIIAHSSIV